MKHAKQVLCLTFVLGACAPTLQPSESDGGDAGWQANDASIPAVSGAFRHEVGADGVVTSVVDATDTEAWRHLDLETGEQIDPAASNDWDVGFSRFRVRTNGGVSGTGGTQVAALEGQAFETLSRAPDEGWALDAPDGADEDTEPDNAFNDGEDDWYAYDVTTHTLTPRDVTYAIATGAGRFYKLRFDGYYDGAGSPGFVTFRWAEIAPPISQLPDAGPSMPIDGGAPADGGSVVVPSDAITIDASDREVWIHVHVGEGVVSIADPASSSDWDLAFRRAAIVTNGGTSGPGVGGARATADGTAFGALVETGTLGFVTDALEQPATPGGEPTSANPVLDEWFSYDVTTHAVTPRDRVFVVRSATGGYAKLRVWTWTGGVFRVSLEAIERRVETIEIDIDATSSETWTHLSLRDGAPVGVTDPATDLRWDVAISRTRWRTNGGTSGGAMGQAAAGTTGLAELVEAPAEGWAFDTMITDGPPGSPEFSGSPALATWYAYDPVTHTVTPQPIAFAIRTADGHLAKLQILAYAGGAYRVALAFAGPRRTSF